MITGRSGQNGFWADAEGGVPVFVFDEAGRAILVERPRWPSETPMGERRQFVPIIRMTAHLPHWRPWHERQRVEGEMCEVCRGLALTACGVCLGCCRSGCDHLLEPVKAHERPRPAKTPATIHLAGGTGRKQRKAARKSRARDRWAGWVPPEPQG